MLCCVAVPGTALTGVTRDCCVWVFAVFLLEEFIAGGALFFALLVFCFLSPKNMKEFLPSNMWLIWMKMTTIFLSIASVVILRLLRHILHLLPLQRIYILSEICCSIICAMDSMLPFRNPLTVILICRPKQNWCVIIVTPLKKQVCGHLCRDDASASTLEELGQVCGHLWRDDDSAALSARKELKATFCEKIKSSTSMNLKSASKCSIVMVAETTI